MQCFELCFAGQKDHGERCLVGKTARGSTWFDQHVVPTVCGYQDESKPDETAAGA